MVQHEFTRTQDERMIQALAHVRVTVIPPMNCPVVGQVVGGTCRMASNGVSQLQGVAVQEPIRNQSYVEADLLVRLTLLSS